MSTIHEPIGWWRMDGDVVASAGVNGTAVGSPTFTAGQVGKAISLNGSSQYVQLGDNFDFETTSPFSMGLWAKCDTATPSTSLLLLDKIVNSGNFPGWVLLLAGATSGDPFQCVLNANAVGQALNIQFPHTMSTDWMHLLWTYNGSENSAGMKLYKSGAELTGRTVVSATLASGGASSVTSATCCIGARNGAIAPWSGLIDDIRIYDFELSPAQASELAAWPRPYPYAICI